jgi:membrane protein
MMFPGAEGLRIGHIEYRIPHVDRKDMVRLATFWLRPAFVLRVVNRFQKVAGFDRAIALASSALTALIPLAIIASAISVLLGGKDTAQRIIDHYDLTGGGAEAVRDIFAPPSGTSTSLGIIGALFLLIAVLSFTRGVQRLFEQAWELKPLSVRNTVNGLTWIGGLAAYVAIVGVLHALFGRSKLELSANLLTMPITAVFLIWSGWLLSAKRIARRDLYAFGFVGAVLLGCYSVGATVYVPHLFNTYATRYGVIGAVFAMISTLFCVTVVLVASAAAGREVHDELDKIRRGEQPPEDDVRREWDEVIAEARSRWDVARQQLDERRRRRSRRSEGSRR